MESNQMKTQTVFKEVHVPTDSCGIARTRRKQYGRSHYVPRVCFTGTKPYQFLRAIVA
jgi:hypothetical protein